MNAEVYAASASCQARIERMPWPVSKSPRSRNGLPLAHAACRRAVLFAGWKGATLGSVAPVVTSTAGYRLRSMTAWSLSMPRSVRTPAGSPGTATLHS